MRADVDSICIPSGPSRDEVQAALDSFLDPSIPTEIDEDGYAGYPLVVDFPVSVPDVDGPTFAFAVRDQLRKILGVEAERSEMLRFINVA